MKLKLINEPTKEWSTLKQILYNRGFTEESIERYIHLNESAINEPEGLGLEALEEGVKKLIKTISNNEDIVVLVDCDCDGYTSAAVLLNYLYRLFPTWTGFHSHFILHEGKQHGLGDVMEQVIQSNASLVICPDSSSNDYTFHKTLTDLGKEVLVLDHHLADKISPYATIINNQLSEYPNKELAGVGIVWQFCRYIDKKLNTDIANDFQDLVALGLISDMMSLTSEETRALIEIGLKESNIKNPFISNMIEKNGFPLSKADYCSSQPEQACTPIGATFFIVPFVNAITRTGTLEEKELIFQSMLERFAYTYVPEIKYNRSTGKDEFLVNKAIRVIGNVKNRQTKDEEQGMLFLSQKIEDEHLLDNKILLFLLEPGDIRPEIRGLVANKYASKYQRPCAVLTLTEKEDGTLSYEGSMRGYTRTGLTSFKQLLEQCPGVTYVQGHDNAAGVGIKANQINEFLATANKLMENISSELVEYVDYIFEQDDEDATNRILDIAGLNDYWGQDIPRAFVGIRFKITSNNFTVMKSNTLKITLPNGISLIKFKGSDEDIENFTTTGYKEVIAYCKCNGNSWNGIVTPQLIIQEYEILSSQKYLF